MNLQPAVSVSPGRISTIEIFSKGFRFSQMRLSVKSNAVLQIEWIKGFKIQVLVFVMLKII